VSRLLSLVAAVLAAAAVPARAQDDIAPDARRGPNAVAVRLRVAPAVLRTQITHPDPHAPFGPPNPSCTAPVGEQARDAWVAAIGRSFAHAPEGSPADLELELAAVSRELEWDADGWLGVVEHSLVLRDGAGAELGRWKTRGEGRVAGIGPRAIPRAFEQAAKVAAAGLERGLAGAERAAAWLQARGVVLPATALAPPPRRDPPALTRPPEGPPRADWVAFADLGGVAITGFVNDEPERSSSEGYVGAFQVLAGLSSPFASARFAFARWGGSFDPDDSVRSDRATARVLSFGLEAGPTLRLRPDLELHGGIGARLLSATAESSRGQTYDPPSSITSHASRIVPVAYGAITYAGMAPGAGVRIRVGLEARRFMGASLRFEELGREIQVAEYSLGLLFGVERATPEASRRSTPPSPR
jgi:hypothetical protein